MTKLHRLGLVCVGAAVVAAGTAAPAGAINPPADGYYTFSQAGLPSATWELQSLCSQASGTRIQSDYTDPTIQAQGCTVNWSSKTPSRLTRDERLVNFSNRGKLIDGLWTITIKNAEGKECPGGGYLETTDSYAFSEVSLTGTHSSIWGEGCGLQPGMTKEPFTLSFIGPLDPPVDNRFPMQCDYLAGRPSICS